MFAADSKIQVMQFYFSFHLYLRCDFFFFFEDKVFIPVDEIKKFLAKIILCYNCIGHTLKSIPAKFGEATKHWRNNF